MCYTQACSRCIEQSMIASVCENMRCQTCLSHLWFPQSWRSNYKKHYLLHAMGELFDTVQSLYRNLSDEVVYLILSLAAGISMKVRKCLNAYEYIHTYLVASTFILQQ